MFSVLLTRSQSAFAPGNPNALATAVAAEVGAALAADARGLARGGRQAQRRRCPPGDPRPAQGRPRGEQRALAAHVQRFAPRRPAALSGSGAETAPGERPDRPGRVRPGADRRRTARPGRAAAPAAARAVQRGRPAAVAARHADAVCRRGAGRRGDLPAGAPPVAGARTRRRTHRRRRPRRPCRRSPARRDRGPGRAPSTACRPSCRPAPTRCTSPIGCDGRCSPTCRTSCARR